MGGNGASSQSATLTLQQVASTLGQSTQTIMASVQFLIQTGRANSTQQALQQIANSKDDRNVLWATMTIPEENQLRRDMGETGDEAGRVNVMPFMKTYVATSKSYNINYYLEHDQQSIVCPYRDQDGNFISNWHRHGLTESDIKNTIRTMDAGAKPLTRTINTVRCESSSQTLSQFGITQSMKELSKMSPAELTKALYGRGRASKAYISTTTNETGNRNTGFKGRDVLIEYTISKGVHGIMTNNTAEREFIVGRGYDQKVTGARWENVNVGGKTERKLVLSVKVVPGARSQYYDLR